MAYIMLPPEITALHEAFGRKKLGGEVGEIAQAFRSTNHFDYYAYKARVAYGLTPRQLSIQFAMACLLTPEFINRLTPSTLCSYPWPLTMVNRTKAVQETYCRVFWARIS